MQMTAIQKVNMQMYCIYTAWNHYVKNHEDSKNAQSLSFTRMRHQRTPLLKAREQDKSAVRNLTDKIWKCMENDPRVIPFG